MSENTAAKKVRLEGAVPLFKESRECPRALENTGDWLPRGATVDTGTVAIREFRYKEVTVTPIYKGGKKYFVILDDVLRAAESQDSTLPLHADPISQDELGDLIKKSREIVRRELAGASFENALVGDCHACKRQNVVERIYEPIPIPLQHLWIGPRQGSAMQPIIRCSYCKVLYHDVPPPIE